MVQTYTTILEEEKSFFRLNHSLSPPPPPPSAVWFSSSNVQHLLNNFLLHQDLVRVRILHYCSQCYFLKKRCPIEYRKTKTKVIYQFNQSQNNKGDPVNQSNWK